jgi:hypothetical protein
MRLTQASARPIAMLGGIDQALYRPAFVVLLTGLALANCLPAQPPTAEPSSPAPVLLTEKMQIGQTGMGPGMLSDAQYVAVDGKGFIYVAEGHRNRIQRFDPEGRFDSLFFVDLEHPDDSPSAMTVNRAGVVYVSRYAQLDRFDGATGKHLGRVEGPNEYEDVHCLAPTPDGGVLVAWGSSLVLLDREGKMVRSAVIPDAHMNPSIQVAMDGEGWVYAIENWMNPEPLKRFKIDGKLVSMFGTEWSETNEIKGVGGLAIDGLGRVFIADERGIHVYSRAGRKLGSFSHAAMRGIAVNARGELIAAEGDRVIRYTVSP